MTTFVKQYYSSKPFIPREIILGAPLLKDEESTIAQWLESCAVRRWFLPGPRKARSQK